MQKTLVIIKPDAVNRGIMGEIIHRFERKGLKVVGLKMDQLRDEVLQKHYEKHRGKPFFKTLKEFMKVSPTLLMVIEGNKAIPVVRKMAGVTYGAEALPGTIRGDYSLSHQHNIIHASDSEEAAEKEIKRFFKKDEIFPYRRIDWEMVYAEDERE